MLWPELEMQWESGTNRKREAKSKGRRIIWISGTGLVSFLIK